MCLQSKIHHRPCVNMQNWRIRWTSPNEIVNVTADMLSMVCKDVKKEPTLSPTPDSNAKLRADISVRCFW